MVGVSRLVDMITFPAPGSSYSLTSHLDDLFFIPDSASDKTPIPVMYLPCGNRHTATFVLVHTHSNGCDMGDMANATRELGVRLNAHCFLLEYPNYGLFERPRTDKQGVDKACARVRDFFIDVLKIPPDRLIWFGRSIGSGPAVQMAVEIGEKYGQEKVGGVVLQCAFSSFKAVAMDVASSLSYFVKAFVREKWNNADGLKKITVGPTLILHGNKDTMIPPCHADRNWDAVQTKESGCSRIVKCACCGHNDYKFACTLKPMSAFLLSLEDSERYANAAPVKFWIPTKLRPKIGHLQMLRARIPCHTLRRLTIDDLEDKLGGWTDTNSGTTTAGGGRSGGRKQSTKKRSLRGGGGGPTISSQSKSSSAEADNADNHNTLSKNTTNNSILHTTPRETPHLAEGSKEGPKDTSPSRKGRNSPSGADKYKKKNSSLASSSAHQDFGSPGGKLRHKNSDELGKGPAPGGKRRSLEQHGGSSSSRGLLSCTWADAT